MKAPLLEMSFVLDKKYGSVNANLVSEGLFHPKNNIRGVFISTKKLVQQIVQTWINSEKPAPLTPPVREEFFVGSPRPHSFDPVNWHITEKIVVDVLVKNGLLPDDDYKNIPEVTFRPLPDENRGEYEFKIQFFPYEAQDRDLFTSQSEK